MKIDIETNKTTKMHARLMAVKRLLDENDNTLHPQLDEGQ
jgi:hypothetical protein